MSSGTAIRVGADVVALCAPNSIEFVVAWYAASMAGAILTTLNPAFRGEEITHSEELTRVSPPVGGRVAGGDWGASGA